MGGHDEIIHVRCDKELKTLVRRAAGHEDMSLSDYTRDRLRQAADDDLPDAAQPEN